MGRCFGCGAAILYRAAKPIIDILLEVTSLDLLDTKTLAIESLGYEAKGEFGISGRRYFRLNDGAGRRTHQVHAFAVGNQNALRHIAFRDYMKAHPLVAVGYGELKARLASENPHDMDAYINGEDTFVKEHQNRAMLWIGR